MAKKKAAKKKKAARPSAAKKSAGKKRAATSVKKSPRKKAAAKKKAAGKKALKKKGTAKRKPAKASAAAKKPATKKKAVKKAAVKKKAAGRKRAAAKSLGRPRVAGDAKLDIVFQKDYSARHAFQFLGVTTLRELEELSADDIIDRLTRPAKETVQRIRKSLAFLNRSLVGDRDFALKFRAEFDARK